MTRLRSESVLGEIGALLNDGTLTGLGEGQLLERFLTDRDEAAFAELIARHGPMVSGNCRRWLDDPHEVEDAFQEIRRLPETVKFPQYQGTSMGFSLKANTFCPWDASTKRLLDSLHSVGQNVSIAAFSPDGTTIASNGGPSVPHFWDVGSQRDRLAEPDAPREQVDLVLVTPDGKTLISGNSDRTLRLWDLTTGKQRRLMTPEGSVRTLSLSPDGGLLLTGHQFPGRAYLWDLANAERPTTTAHEDSPNSGRFPIALRYSTDQSVAVCWSDGTVKALGSPGASTRGFAKASSATEAPVELDDQKLSAGAFSKDGRRLAAIQFFGGLFVADLATGKEIHQVPGALMMVTSPDEHCLAITRTDGDFVIKSINGMKNLQCAANSSIAVLDFGTGKEKYRIGARAHRSGPWPSPDGKTLAATTGWERGQIHFHETTTGTKTRTITTPPIRTSALAFTPDGSRLVTAMADTSVLVWDLRFDP